MTIENENNIDNSVANKKNDTNKIAAVIIGIFAIASIIIWQIPSGKFILYPFTILGTWFHEMGHGLAAILLGGNFIRLELFPDGSGVATYSGNLFLGDLGKAIVAAAGPLGPTFFGVILIISTRKPELAKFVLIFLSVLLIISLLLWIRPVFAFGFISILLFSILFFLVSLSKNIKLQIAFVSFLGVQSIISVYTSLDYLFSPYGDLMRSDTYVIQEILLLPYWFWGGVIVLISALAFIYSFRVLLFSKQKDNSKIVQQV